MVQAREDALSGVSEQKENCMSGCADLRSTLEAKSTKCYNKLMFNDRGEALWKAVTIRSEQFKPSSFWMEMHYDRLRRVCAVFIVLTLETV